MSTKMKLKLLKREMHAVIEGWENSRDIRMHAITRVLNAYAYHQAIDKAVFDEKMQAVITVRQRDRTGIAKELYRGQAKKAETKI